MKRNKHKKSVEEKMSDMRSKIKVHAKAASRLMKRVDAMKGEMEDLMKSLRKTNAAKVESLILTLPEEQRPLVQACFDAAKFHNKQIESTLQIGFMNAF
ncbi:Non-structural protein 1 [Frankliniella fusca]|uniref:Non-structural protein 1 n=1 Tax=Frankliniella fusca TaxID=407009 RepID=A0AAE1LT93_9NEOP|nr:Non-structural protein 1 [Frankliniella fusca]